MIASTPAVSRLIRHACRASALGARAVGSLAVLAAAMAFTAPQTAQAQGVEIQPEYRLEPPVAPDLTTPDLPDEEAPSREEVEKALRDQQLEDQQLEDQALEDQELEQQAGEEQAGESQAGEQTPAADLDPDSEEAVAADFAELRSEDEAVWRAAQERIARRWSKSGSDSMDLLLKRGRDAMEREDWDRAIQHFTDLVNLAPDFAEGWNSRATAHFRKDDYGAALSDIAATLALEPRHFGALAGLGRILDEIGEADAAYAAYRRALELHPHLEGPKEGVERLGPEVDGRGA